jgi:hypothetical protein
MAAGRTKTQSVAGGSSSLSSSEATTEAHTEGGGEVEAEAEPGASLARGGSAVNGTHTVSRCWRARITHSRWAASSTVRRASARTSTWRDIALGVRTRRGRVNSPSAKVHIRTGAGLPRVHGFAPHVYVCGLCAAGVGSARAMCAAADGSATPSPAGAAHHWVCFASHGRTNNRGFRHRVDSNPAVGRRTRRVRRVCGARRRDEATPVRPRGWRQVSVALVPQWSLDVSALSRPSPAPPAATPPAPADRPVRVRRPHVHRPAMGRSRWEQKVTPGVATSFLKTS